MKYQNTKVELAYRAAKMSFDQFNKSLTPDEYREITFFNGGTILDFWARCQ